MSNYYKVIVTTTYRNEVIVKADSVDDIKQEDIVKKINLLDDIPEVNSEVEEMKVESDDIFVDFDLTTTK